MRCITAGRCNLSAAFFHFFSPMKPGVRSGGFPGSSICRGLHRSECCGRLGKWYLRFFLRPYFRLASRTVGMSVTCRHVRMAGAVEAFFAGYDKKRSTYAIRKCFSFIVGVPGFEPGTSNSRSWRANRAALHPERVPRSNMASGHFRSNAVQR